MKITLYSGMKHSIHAERIMSLMSIYAPQHRYEHSDNKDCTTDLWHCLSPHPSWRGERRARRSVVALPDLRFVNESHIYSLRERLFLLPALKSHCRHAAHLLAPSQRYRELVVESLGVDPRRVSVCSSLFCMEDEHHERCEQEAVRSKFGLPQTFLLARGGIDGSFNHATLIKAVASMEQKLELVICGRHTIHADVLRGVVEDYGMEGRVSFIYEIEPHDMALLYDIALAFVYLPSLDSSVRPIIDALRAHTPMILSDTELNREAAGAAASYVNPRCEESIVGALHQALYDDSYRGQLIAQSHAEAERYSQESAARQLAEIYESI